MLRSFRVENHKSIKDEQELSLLPAYDKSRPVVPVAAIFGANASGKSNLLDALRWLQNAVRTSYAAWEAGSGVPRTPFRLDAKSAESPSGYAVEIEVDGARYSYGVEVDGERVRNEWLHTYPRSRRRIIFERDDDGLRLGSTVPDYKTRAVVLARQTRGNALFLSVAAQNDLAEVRPVYDWFRAGLMMADEWPERWAEEFGKLIEGPRRRTVVDLVRAADVGITDIRFAPGYQMHRWLDIEFRHGASDTWLTTGEESAGTVRWLHLIVPTLRALDTGAVLCVDEIDASMHPRLTASFVGLFRDSQVNRHAAQLVFTTHDATLLDPILGDDTMRRDEVWFVEKQGDGATTLYSLADFKPRKLENWERRYLAGGYGAIPLASEWEFRRAFDDDTAA